jgi:hypothetical protein
MRIPELYGYILTIAIYFLIIKEYRRHRKIIKARKDEME